jgi:SAM-dependent methyltransferase
MIDNLHPCRSCGQHGLLPILSLGRMPLANDLLTAEQLDEPAETFPLDLVFCPRCALVQITETVPPERLFRQYLYFSSYSTTMIDHVRKLVAELIPARNLDEKSLVVELASNDGYLLQFYQQAGIPVLGIEPAVNVARIAQERGIRTMMEFFGEGLACTVPSADIVHAHNVLAHVADLNGFVEGIAMILKPHGMAVIEVPYIKDMIDGCEFDTIYHEHLCYFSLTSLEDLFTSHGLVIREAQRVPIHGGSLLLFLTPVGKSPRLGIATPSLARLRLQELDWRASQIDFYLAFAGRIQELRSDLLDLLDLLKHEGKRIAAYGAAAKGAMLLNYCGIGKGILDFVVDQNPHKQGRYIPGVGLRVYPPDVLLASMPDYLLILPWNLADEIMGQQAEYRRRGGQFILPIPEPRIVYP